MIDSSQTSEHLEPWDSYPPGTQAVSDDGYIWTKWVDGSWRGCEEGNFLSPGNATRVLPARLSNMRVEAAFSLLGAEFIKRTRYEHELQSRGFGDDEARFRAEWQFSGKIEQLEEDVRLAQYREQVK